MVSLRKVPGRKMNKKNMKKHHPVHFIYVYIFIQFEDVARSFIHSTFPAERERERVRYNIIQYNTTGIK